MTRAQEAIEELNDAIDGLHVVALHLLAMGRLELAEQIVKSADRLTVARAELWRNG